MTFSEKLAAAIREKHMSFRELSEKTGIPKSAIQRYTSGATEKIPIDRLKLLAEALGIDPAYIMGWAEEQEPSDRTPEEEEELMEYLEQLRRNPDLRIMFSLTKNATKEDVQKAVAVVKALLGKNDD